MMKLGCVLYATVFVLLLIQFQPSRIPFSLLAAEGRSYEYYGYVPNLNYTYGLDADPEPVPTLEDPHPGWHINGTAYLDIVGIEDDTEVSVYGIMNPDEPRLLASKTIDRMELWTYRLPRDYYFKVSADKRVAVTFGGGTQYGATYGGFSCFYPSTDGGFAGKEFIFLAQLSRRFGTGDIPVHHAIYAVDDAHVTIYDDQDRVVWEKDIAANNARQKIQLEPPREVYRVVSTGRIMVANWVVGDWIALPNSQGGYVGMRFFASQNSYEGAGGISGQTVLMIAAQDEDTHVKVASLLGKFSVEEDVAARSVWIVEGKDVPMRGEPTEITSNKLIMVFAGEMNAIPQTDPNAMYQGSGLMTMRDSTAFFGVRADEPITFQVLAQAIVFSPEADAEVIVEPYGLTLDVKKGYYAQLPTGVITVKANTTVIIEALSQTERPKLVSVGGYLINNEAVEIEYSPPKVSEGELPLVPIAVAVAAVAIVAAVFLKKRL